MQIKSFYRNECKGSLMTFIYSLLSFSYYKPIKGKSIFTKQHTTIKGVKNITLPGKLVVGLSTTGFTHRKDLTYLNIRGKLILGGNYTIGAGCRFDIGPGAVVRIGRGGYTNAFTNFIISNSLTVGNNCVISWNCQFLDDDFHTITYADKKPAERKGIEIGDHVWIGCGVKIYKGTVIPEGCVIASDSVVKGVFTEKNALIAGNPAKIIKQHINWE